MRFSSVITIKSSKAAKTEHQSVSFLGFFAGEISCFSQSLFREKVDKYIKSFGLEPLILHTDTGFAIVVFGTHRTPLTERLTQEILDGILEYPSVEKVTLDFFKSSSGGKKTWIQKI